MILNRKPADVFKDVAAFAELAQPHMLPKDGQLNHQALQLALKLIEEECNREYIPALKAFIENPSKENLIKVIDGNLDTIYVCSWALRILGVDGTPFWNEVQRSNMAKFPLESEKVLARPLEGMYDDVPVEVNLRKGRWVLTNADTGKVIKPQGWTQPDLFGIAEELQNIHDLRNRPDMISTVFMKDYFHSMENRIEKGEISG